MRKGRFSGLSDARIGAVSPPALIDLLLFDFRAPEDEDDERVAAERARTLGVSMPYLAASHGLWAAILLVALAGEGIALDPLRILLPLAVVLLVDAGLCLLLRGRRAAAFRPHAIVRIAGLGILVTAALWAIVIASTAGVESTLVRAALIAGIGAAIPTFFAAPGLLILSLGAILAGVALMRSEEPLLTIGAPLALFLSWLSLSRARDQILSAHRRLKMEW